MERGRVGGACLWPGGAITLGDDGAYEGLCDSWDSFSPFLNRADVGESGLMGNIVHVFKASQGVGVTFEGGMGREAPPQITRGASE